jgi:hypothetical protein
MADIEKDLLIPGENERASPVRTPVMPGGLFAMDRLYFFTLGEYDPEILYYGAEHVELSFRVWMCVVFVLACQQCVCDVCLLSFISFEHARKFHKEPTQQARLHTHTSNLSHTGVFAADCLG